LHFLPTESQAAFSQLGHIIDSKWSGSKLDSEIETTKFRQAVYVRWAKNMNITKPCGAGQSGYKQIVACFIKNLMLNHNSCSATTRGYAKSINMLFCFCNFLIPEDFLDQNNICIVLISDREKEENIPSPKNVEQLIQ
jgi:hypothetical protein